MFENFNPRIECNDGFTISVQARESSYCQRNTEGKPVTVECGFPSTKPKTPEFLLYAEDNSDYTETVYPYIPVEVVEAELAALDQTQSANRDQFGITRPGTDEIDGHERVSFCVPSVVRASRCFA